MLELRQIKEIMRRDVDPYQIGDGQEIQQTEVHFEESVSEKEK